MNIKSIVALPVLAVLAACGGGGGTTPSTETPSTPPSTETPSTPPSTETPSTPAVSDLSSVVSTDQLQALNLTGSAVEVGTTTKAASSANWDSNLQGSYVVVLNNGDIVGIAATTIPNSVTFSETGSASAVFVNDNVEYDMSGGNVTGSIDDEGTLTVGLSEFTDYDVATGDGSSTDQYLNDVVAATITSTLSGSDCDAVNLFCGGQISVTVDAVNAAAIAADETEAVIGVYGASSAYELGGVINATDTVNNDSFTGSFIATQE